MSLKNKKVVLCRRREQAGDIVRALQARGAWPLLFPTFAVEPFTPDPAELDKIRRLDAYDWLIFGSENGVQFFYQLMQSEGNSIFSGPFPEIAVVGRKTAARWEKLFPHFPVRLRANYLQQLLDRLANLPEDLPLRVLNITSQQGLENIALTVPEELDFHRVAIYRTVPNRALDAAEIEFVRSGNYEVVYFGSPSAFDYFRHIVGDEPLERVAIAVAGNTTRGHIERLGFRVAIVPDTPAAADLVGALERYFDPSIRVEEGAGENGKPTAAAAGDSGETLFLRACFRQPVKRTPVWMMRQAGRYLPQYQEVRRRYDFQTMYKTPEAAVEVTLQPVEILEVDAAILFSDILVIPEAMGLALQFTEGQGPVFPQPIRSDAAVKALHPVDPEEDLAYVLAAIRLLRRELEGKVPLIGFSGAPWTLATYMVEGRSSKNFLEIKKWRFGNPEGLENLLEKITTAVIAYLRAQIAAGAQAVQIFDSWAGILDPEGFRRFALPYVRRIVRAVRTPGVPIIYFAKGAGLWLETLLETEADVLGLDWTMDIGVARKLVRNRIALQGNLDPVALFAPPEIIRREVRRILTRYGQGSGHIFNLGHGILPNTPVEHARAFVEAVKNESPPFHQSDE